MAQKDSVKQIRIAVIGLPSSSQGSNLGAGKSCLCNRFTRSGEDNFSINHSSVLNHEDFTGPIVNNTHFIYWGQTTCTADDGTQVCFQIIEQTEFSQDGSFKVFSSAQPYMKRAFATKNLPSASGKVAYCGPDQFADPQKYPNPDKFPDKFQIDGFVVCVDMSLNFATTPLEIQKFFDKLISEALASKKPVVIAATKCDKLVFATMEKLQGLLSKSKRPIPLVETSTTENINVELVFYTLADMISKVKFKTKHLSYSDAEKLVKQRKDHLAEQLQQLLKEKVTNCQLTQQQAMEAISTEPVYQSYIALWGSTGAKSLTRKHLRNIHLVQEEKKKAEFLEHLPYCLDQLVPEIDAAANRDDLLEAVRASNDLSKYFVILDDGMEWQFSPVLTSPDQIIPFQFLESDPEAIQLLKEHLLMAQSQSRHNMAIGKIRHALETTPQLKPGHPLEELMTSLNLSYEFNQLNTREELMEVYNACMKKAEAEAIKDFGELLWEHPEMFLARNQQEQEKLASSVDATLDSNILKDEPRFQRLCYRGSKCKVEVLSHLALFAVKKGVIRKSAFQELVANQFPKQEAFMVDDSSAWVLDITDVYYNIALIGKEGMCTNLQNDIMGLCKAGRFKYNDIDYQFEFKTFAVDCKMFSDQDFTPQGAIIIISSEELLTTAELIASSHFGISGKYRGLPVAVVFIGEEFVATSKHPFSVRATRLARQLQGVYLAEKHSVFPDRVLSANSAMGLLQQLLERTRHTDAFLRCEMCPKIADMNVAMCTTPDESYDHEELLPPFLANQLAYYKEDRVMMQVQVEDKFYSVAISYHSSTNLESLLSNPLNGFIVVYSANRKASWNIATFLVTQLPQIPTLLVCVSNSTSSNELINEGEVFANSKDHVFFLRTDDYWKPGCLNEFLAKCWFSRFSSMQKQHVKIASRLSTRALPSRPQSEHITLRTLPSTPSISHERPVSTRLPMSPQTSGRLAPLRDLLSINDDVEGETYDLVETYDSVDGCTSSRMAHGKDDLFEEPVEYASSEIARQLVAKTLPRIRDLPSQGDGLYSVAAGDKESHDPNDGLYSVMDDDRPPLPVPQDQQPDDVYSAVDEPKNTTPSSSQQVLVHKPAVKRKPAKPQAEDVYSVVNKSPVTATQQQPEDIYSVVQKPTVKKKPVRSQTPTRPTQDIYSVVNKPPARKLSSEQQPEDLYSVVSKPSNTGKTAPQHDPQELYSVVQKPASRNRPPPTVRPKPVKQQTEELYSVVDKTKRPPSTTSLPEVIAESQGKQWVNNDLYAEVTPKKLPQGGIQNGDIYAAVDKPKAPPPVTNKPLSRSRVTSDSDIQEDTISRDSGVVEEEEPSIPDRLYDDDDILELEPPPLPPRMYSLSDFESEDELCFDDIMSGDEDLSGGDSRMFNSISNPTYESTSNIQSALSAAGQRDQKREEANPLYQTMAELRKEMELAKNNISNTMKQQTAAEAQKRAKIEERLRRQAEKEKVRRLKQEERNRKRAEETKKRQEEARIREEKKQLRRRGRAGSRKVPPKPYNPPNEAAGGRYFGLPLLEVCSVENPIPVYVEQCARIIEEQGIRQLGIYRVSGKKDDVLELHAKFDEDPKMDIAPLDMCVNALASGLKSFFKLLPDPLISEDIGIELLTVAKLPDEDQLFQLKERINKMPEVNRKILHFLASHLNRIMAEREVNKMNASNLAIVFWPTLMRPPLADLADLSKQIDWQLMMTRIIENPDISSDSP